jgi:hypothetical protein
LKQQVAKLVFAASWGWGFVVFSLKRCFAVSGVDFEALQ